MQAVERGLQVLLFLGQEGAALGRDGDRGNLAPVDEEHDDVGLGDRRFRLPRHLAQDAVLRHGLESAGVDDDELARLEQLLNDWPVDKDAAP